MKMRLSLLAATLVAPFALSACVVEDDSAADTTEAAVADAGSQAAAEADAAADRAEAADPPRAPADAGLIASARGE